MIAITGASGALGSRVAARLAERGVPLRLVVRDPARAPRLEGAEVAVAAGYGDGEAMRRALQGASTMLFVSAGEAEHRVPLHTTAVDAAVAAGVERIVYTSFVGAAPDCTFTFARDHFHTEEHIRGTGVGHTFLRDSIYLDYVPLFALPEGVIRGPAADGRFAAVARDDVADVAAAVLTDEGHDGETYDVTGPEAFTMAEAAAEISRATGGPVAFEDETLEQARASRAPSGAPGWEIEGWVTTYAAIAAGELDVVSDTVERIAGHPPTGLAEWLQRHPESCDHLRS
jgi:NAD(P)H dehydrogenase (quinone)